MILTNEEIMQINQTAEFDSALGYARKIEQAVLESYKAELLKEAGDPVLYAEFAEDGGWLGDASEYQYLLEEPHALYTSDQLVAAVLKATKPLEERRCEICGYAEHHREHTGCLRTQLTTAREEIDQLRQRVQELEKDAARYNWLISQEAWEPPREALPKWYGGKIKWLGGDYSIDETNEIIDAARGES